MAGRVVEQAPLGEKKKEKSCIEPPPGCRGALALADGLKNNIRVVISCFFRLLSGLFPAFYSSFFCRCVSSCFLLVQACCSPFPRVEEQTNSLSLDSS